MTKQLLPGLCLLSQTVNANKPDCCIVWELVTFFIGGEFFVVQTVWALHTHHDSAAFVQTNSNRAGHEPLVLFDEAHQVLVERTKPQPVVNDVADSLCDERLEPHGLPAERQVLKFAVSRMQNDGRRSFVDLTALDANQSVLNVINPANAVFSTNFVELFDKRNAVHRFSVERRWATLFEVDHNFDWFVG